MFFPGCEAHACAIVSPPPKPARPRAPVHQRLVGLAAVVGEVGLDELLEVADDLAGVAAAPRAVLEAHAVAVLHADAAKDAALCGGRGHCVRLEVAGQRWREAGGRAAVWRHCPALGCGGGFEQRQPCCFARRALPMLGYRHSAGRLVVYMNLSSIQRRCKGCYVRLGGAGRGGTRPNSTAIYPLDLDAPSNAMSAGTYSVR